MNRRGFLTTCASLLPLPAFVKAASLWLPPERPKLVDTFGTPFSQIKGGELCRMACEMSDGKWFLYSDIHGRWFEVELSKPGWVWPMPGATATPGSGLKEGE